LCVYIYDKKHVKVNKNSHVKVNKNMID
jgi:hypothetical protein